MALSTLPLEFRGRIELCLEETQWAVTHPGKPCYSFETLQRLKQKYSEPLAFVLGTDQLENLPNWYRFPEVLELARWLVLPRLPDSIAGAKIALQKLRAQLPVSSGEQFEILHALIPEVSSTELREQLARTGTPPQNTLPVGIYEYLIEKHLYGTGRDI